MINNLKRRIITVEQKKYKPVIVTEQRALKQIYIKAEREHRPLANAASAIILDALPPKSDNIEESKEGQG